MPLLTHHIFVCCNQRAPAHTRGCCDPGGSERLRNEFKAEIERHGLSVTVQGARSGCLNQCELGPAVVIYPQAIWYGRVRVEDARRIIEETVIGGRILEDLVIPPELLNSRQGWESGGTSAAAAGESSL